MCEDGKILRELFSSQQHDVRNSSRGKLSQRTIPLQLVLALGATYTRRGDSSRRSEYVFRCTAHMWR